MPQSGRLGRISLSANHFWFSNKTLHEFGRCAAGPLDAPSHTMSFLGLLQLISLGPRDRDTLSYHVRYCRLFEGTIRSHTSSEDIKVVGRYQHLASRDSQLLGVQEGIRQAYDMEPPCLGQWPFWGKPRKSKRKDGVHASEWTHSLAD